MGVLAGGVLRDPMDLLPSRQLGRSALELATMINRGCGW